MSERRRALYNRARNIGVWGEFQHCADTTVRRMLALPGHGGNGNFKSVQDHAYAAYGWHDKQDRIHLVCYDWKRAGLHAPKIVSLWIPDLEQVLSRPAFTISDMSPDPTLSDEGILRMVAAGAPQVWEELIEERSNDGLHVREG